MDDLLTTRPLWMELDPGALKSNLEQIRRQAGSKRIIASIKADAYGHGVVEVARQLHGLGVEMLASGSFADAMAVRNANIDVRILMFGSCIPEGIPQLLRHRLIPTIHHRALAKATSVAAKRDTPVFIKVDCGFGRLGVPLSEAHQFVRHVANLPHLIVEGLYTHLPFFDEPGREWARQRLVWFDQLISRLADDGLHIPITQAMASSCLVAGLTDHCNAVCPGHELYGVSPVAEDLFDLSYMQPVLRAVKAKLIQVTRHDRDHTFGVGGQDLLETGSRIGVLPMGLIDGYFAGSTGNPAVVLMRGRRVPVMGINLEHTTINLSGVDYVEVGDEVTVLGQDGNEQITVAEMAGWRSVSPVNVLMSFTGRIQRRWIPQPPGTPDQISSHHVEPARAD